MVHRSWTLRPAAAARRVQHPAPVLPAAAQSVQAIETEPPLLPANAV